MYVSDIIAIIVAIVGFTAFFIVFFKNISATKKRAQEIDPSVKTMAEARYVLSKELANNVGKNKKTIFCKHCGKEIDDDSKFCKHCGKNQ